MAFPKALLLLLAGLLLLFAGGEAFVAGASQLARRLRIPPVVIGLTVVSLGTSTPELAVALAGIQRQQAALVLGNVVGSNLFNLMVVLGACALVMPLRVTRRLVRRDLPVLLVATLAVWGMAASGRMLWPAGVALLMGLAINLVWELVSALEQSRLQRRADHDAPFQEQEPLIAALGLQGLGIGLLVLGSELLINGALAAARQLGIGETVIGLTLVAAATSLPELVTSLVAAYHRRADLAIGNAVGSSVLNLLLILGLAVLCGGSSGLEVPAVLLQRDLPVLVLVTLICLPILWSYATIRACDGALLLGLYGLYLLEQVVLARLPTAVGAFRLAVVIAIGPVIAFLGWGVVRWWRLGRGGDDAPPVH